AIGPLVALWVIGQRRPNVVRGRDVGVVVDGAHVDEEFSPRDEARLEAKASVGARQYCLVWRRAAIIGALIGPVWIVPGSDRGRVIREHQLATPRASVHHHAAGASVWSISVAELQLEREVIRARATALGRHAPLQLPAAIEGGPRQAAREVELVSVGVGNDPVVILLGPHALAVLHLVEGPPAVPIGDRSL